MFSYLYYSRTWFCKCLLRVLEVSCIKKNKGVFFLASSLSDEGRPKAMVWKATSTNLGVRWAAWMWALWKSELVTSVKHCFSVHTLVKHCFRVHTLTLLKLSMSLSQWHPVADSHWSIFLVVYRLIEQFTVSIVLGPVKCSITCFDYRCETHL